MTSELPPRPNLEFLRKKAKSLHKAAVAGDADAIARVRAVSSTLNLTAAQRALAREHGFEDWAALRAEVERRTGSTQA